MPGRLGPRFAIEVLFLIALAVGAAYADLDAKWIALIMAAGWLVVALLELTSERIWAAVPPWRRPSYAPTMVSPPEPEAVVEHEPEPEPEPVEAVVVEPEPELEPATAIVPAREAEAVAEPEPDEAPEPEPAAHSEPEPPEEPERPRLEPLEPRPKRRWFRRRGHDEPAETPLPELPKHVRLLPPPGRSRADEEVAEILDGVETERRA